jgi:hypothetical protein
MKIGITEVFLGEDIIGVQLSGDPELLDGTVPVAVHGIGIAQIVMRSCFVGRLPDCVGPKQDPVLVEQIPLIGKEEEQSDQDCG